MSRPSGEYKVNTGSGSYNTCDTRGVWQVIRAAGAAETRQEAVYHAPRESTVQGQNRVWQLYHVPRRQVQGIAIASNVELVSVVVYHGW